MNCYCSFCASLGINGPHDHWLRASRKAGGATCCPKLLATECNFCKRKGHTIKFCAEKQDQERLRKLAAKEAQKKAMEGGAWMTSGEKTRSPMVIDKINKPHKIISRFAALDMEECSSSDEEPTTQEVQASPFLSAMAADMAGGDAATWVEIVKQVRAPPALEMDEMDLPPLTFGKKGRSVWADED